MKWIGVPVAAALCMGIGLVAAFNPESILPGTLMVFWTAVFSLILYRVAKRSFRQEWLVKIVLVGLFLRIPISQAHIVAGQVWEGKVDFTGYYENVTRLGFEVLGNQAVEFFILPWEDPALIGQATLERLLLLLSLVFGPVLSGMLLASGMVGFLGSYLFLRAFQAEFGACRETRFLALSLFLFPSLVFWTSLLGKDSWIYLALGWTTYAFVHMVKTMRPKHVLGFVMSVGFVAIVRPQIAAAALAAFSLAFILILPSKLPREGHAAMLRPVGYLLGLVLFGLVNVGGLTVARWSLWELGAQDLPLIEGMLTLAVHKHVGLALDPHAAGSSLPVEITEPTVEAAVRFLPGAMLTFLFRPFVFEAHKPSAAIAALDSTLILILVLLRLRHLLAAIRYALSSPFVVFSGTAFLLFTAMLSFEANFGVMVRHRAGMVLPFLFILLSVPLRKREAGGPPVR